MGLTTSKSSFLIPGSKNTETGLYWLDLIIYKSGFSLVLMSWSDALASLSLSGSERLSTFSGSRNRVLSSRPGFSLLLCPSWIGLCLS